MVWCFLCEATPAQPPSPTVNSAAKPTDSTSQWPQILGPSRNATAEVDLKPSGAWPARALPTWEVALGNGFSGPAVSGNQVFIPHRVQNQEVVDAIALSDGRQLWRATWPAIYSGGYNSDDGPRTVPSITDDRIVVYGAAGDLVCIGRENGQLLWRRELRKEYEAPDGYFGAGASPLVLDGQVITCVGGEKGGIVAVDLETGKTNWTATEFEASYASPIAVGAAQMRRLLVVMRLNTLLLDPADGRVCAEIRFGSRGPTVNAATPIAVNGDQYLLTASYNVGATLLKIEGDQLTELYRGSRILSSQYNTPVRVGALVYGIDGREDVGRASLVCLDPQKEEPLWKQPGFGVAHLVATKSGILALDLSGQLTLLAASNSEFEPLQTTALPSGMYRALPAVLGKTLLVRTSDSGSAKLMRIDLP